MPRAHSECPGGSCFIPFLCIITVVNSPVQVRALFLGSQGGGCRPAGFKFICPFIQFIHLLNPYSMPGIQELPGGGELLSTGVAPGSMDWAVYFLYVTWM